MNLRITTYSLIVAATCGIAFNQAAKADEQDVRTLPSMRFEFQNNNYALDHTTPRRHYVGTTGGNPVSSVHSGSAPKNLLGLDPSFVSKPAPLPVAPPPVVRPTVAAKQILPSNSPFSSIFQHPQTPLVAQAPGALPPISPAAATPAHAGPAISANKGVHAKLIGRNHPAAAVAKSAPPIANYGEKFYSPVAVIPGYSNGGQGADSSVHGTVIKRHH
jgi:hypothetical protein